MRRVLVIGASGFCGVPFATALLRTGEYQVWGATRSKEKAGALQMNEIMPVIGSPANVDSYIDLIRTKYIDTVVDVSQSLGDATVTLAAIRAFGDEQQKASGGLAPRIGYIYVSGTWVHGASPDPHELINDLMPLGRNPPPELVAWRPAVEHQVLAARDVLDVAIVRPALVYGRGSPTVSAWLEPIAAAAEQGLNVAQVKATRDSVVCMAHVDDVASGLVAAVARLHGLAGAGVYPVFDLVTSCERIGDILEAGARALEFKGRIEPIEPDDLFHRALSTPMNVVAMRAVQILGWRPSRIGWARQAPLYARAWAVANRGTRE